MDRASEHSPSNDVGVVGDDVVEGSDGEAELDLPGQVLADDRHTLVAGHQAAADSTRKPDLFRVKKTMRVDWRQEGREGPIKNERTRRNRPIRKRGQGGTNQNGRTRMDQSE